MAYVDLVFCSMLTVYVCIYIFMSSLLTTRPTCYNQYSLPPTFVMGNLYFPPLTLLWHTLLYWAHFPCVQQYLLLDIRDFLNSGALDVSAIILKVIFAPSAVICVWGVTICWIRVDIYVAILWFAANNIEMDCLVFPIYVW